MVSSRVVGLIGFVFGIILTTLVVSILIPGGGGGGGVNEANESSKVKENIKYQPPAKK